LNNAFGLEKTIHSVISQSYKNFEFIIIDGDSNDGSKELILKNEQSINYWLSERDNGIYNAMNKGINVATGDYTFFLNSGDCFVDELVVENVFKTCTNQDFITGNLIVEDRFSKSNQIIRGNTNITFLDVYSSHIKHQATFIKKSLFTQYGLFDESLKIAADWSFFLNVIGIHNVGIQYIDLNIAFYDNNGISNNSENICAQEKQIILDKLVPKNMQQDYFLMKKFNGIRYLNKSKISWLLFRVLLKFTKVFLVKEK